MARKGEAPDFKVKFVPAREVCNHEFTLRRITMFAAMWLALLLLRAGAGVTTGVHAPTGAPAQEPVIIIVK